MVGISNLDKLLLINKISVNKFPLIITLIFFSVFFYISFFHHPYWYEIDGIYYLNWGNDIIHGNGANVKIPDAPVGGSIFWAYLSSIFGDAFIIGKLISLLSGTGIVILAYYITRNIFSSRIATIVQLFFAFNPRLDLLSIEAVNEALPVFLIFISLYFMTKKGLTFQDVFFSGLSLGMASTIRYQAIPVFMAVLFFLLIRDSRVRHNLKYIALLAIAFLGAFSPILIYNYSTHGDLIDSDPRMYMLWFWDFQNQDWRTQMIHSELKTDSGSILSSIMIDPKLFFTNYISNIFYHNPNVLFNFNTLSNIALVSPIPYVSIIPVFGGLFYVLKLEYRKRNLIVLLSSFITIFFILFQTQNLANYFFMMIIIPTLALGIANIRKIETNFLVLLVLAVVYFFMISIVPLQGPYQLLPLWIVIPIFSTLFFVEVIPRIFSIKSDVSKTKSLRLATSSLIIISLILLIQIGFSAAYIKTQLYEHSTIYKEDVSHPTLLNIKTQFLKLFEVDGNSEPAGIEYEKVGRMLSDKYGVKDVYVEALYPGYSYYSGSKYLYTEFREGLYNQSLNKFITRENWSPFDVYESNLLSYPNDRNNIIHPLPSFLVYQPPPHSDKSWYNQKQIEYLKVLSDPRNPKIPSNFKFLFKLNGTDVTVYRIIYDKQVS